MKNFMMIFGNNSVEGKRNGGLLRNPGDRLEAKVTKTNRQVLKVSTNNGNTKYSATRYQNGTIVETKVTKKK